MNILSKSKEFTNFGVELVRDIRENDCPTLNEFSEKSLVLQFHGFELVLMPDGTYYFNDTSGG